MLGGKYAPMPQRIFSQISRVSSDSSSHGLTISWTASGDRVTRNMLTPGSTQHSTERPCAAVRRLPMNFLRSTRWVLFSVGTVGFILSQTGARAQQVRE